MALIFLPSRFETAPFEENAVKMETLARRAAEPRHRGCQMEWELTGAINQLLRV